MRSDLYTITFTTIITVILGLGLSATADSLRERQVLNEELDIKKNILSVLGYKQDTPWTNEEVQSLYDANISEIRVDEVGSVIEELDKTISKTEYKQVTGTKKFARIGDYYVTKHTKGAQTTNYYHVLLANGNYPRKAKGYRPEAGARQFRKEEIVATSKLI